MERSDEEQMRVKVVTASREDIAEYGRRDFERSEFRWHKPDREVMTQEVDVYTDFPSMFYLNQ